MEFKLSPIYEEFNLSQNKGRENRPRSSQHSYNQQDNHYDCSDYDPQPR